MLIRVRLLVDLLVWHLEIERCCWHRALSIRLLLLLRLLWERRVGFVLLRWVERRIILGLLVLRLGLSILSSLFMVWLTIGMRVVPMLIPGSSSSTTTATSTTIRASAATSATSRARMPVGETIALNRWFLSHHLVQILRSCKWGVTIFRNVIIVIKLALAQL